jgi:hypothetical protein
MTAEHSELSLQRAGRLIEAILRGLRLSVSRIPRDLQGTGQLASRRQIVICRHRFLAMPLWSTRQRDLS